MRHQILTFLLSLACLLVAQVQADSSTLYQNGHPVSGKAGSLLGVTALRHCIVASFRALDGEQRLDSFTLATGSAQFADTIAYGNLLEDQTNLIPDAQLKAPRDLATVNGAVLWWSYYKVHVGTLDSACKIQSVKSYDFTDALNPVFNRIESPAQVISKRKALTDQQVADLITSGATQDQVSEALFKSGIYDFSQPELPFLASVGSQLGVLGDGSLERFSLSIDGKSAIAALRDKSALEISVFAPEAKAAHLSAFFGERLKQIFNGSNFALPLSQLREQLLSEELIDELLHAGLLDYLFEISQYEGAGTLVDALKGLAPNNAKLKRVLTRYGLTENSTVRSAVTALVDDALAEYDLTLAQSRLQLAFAQGMSELLYAGPERSLQTIQAELQAAMLAEYSAQGLGAYLVNTLLGPLSEDLPFLKLTFKELLDGVSSNPLAAVIDGALSSLDTALPDEAFLTLFLSAPACLQIPDSSRELLNLALVTSGPKVNPDGIALLELLKLVEYYFENDNYDQLLAELDTRIKEFQGKIALELVSELTRGINFSADLSLSVREVFNQSLSLTLSATSLKEPLVDAILAQLASLNVKPSTKLKSIMLKAARAKLKTRASGAETSARAPAATRKLSKREQQRLLRNLTLGKFVAYVKPKSTQPSLRELLAGALPGSILDTSSLDSSVDQLLQGLFGSISLDHSLGEAAAQLIRSKINHSLVGDFVSETLGQALASMAGNSGGIPIGVKKVWRAAHGDCLAQWQVAFDVAAAAAVLAQLEVVAAEFVLSEQFLSSALDQGIKFVVQQTLSKFLEGIFTDAGGSYPRWNLGLKSTSYSFSLPALSGVTTRLASLFAYRDTLILIQRNNGASLPEPGASAEVVATLFKLDGSKQILSLGSWNTISVSGGADGLLLLSGDHATTPTLLIDIRSGAIRTIALSDTQVPLEFKRPDQVLTLPGDTLMLYGELSGLYLSEIP
jgi:hypothetical protein